MAKMRVHELAKELTRNMNREISSKDIQNALAEKGIENKTASSNVEGQEIEYIRNYFTSKKEKKEEKKEESPQVKKVETAGQGVEKKPQQGSAQQGEKRMSQEQQTTQKNAQSQERPIDAKNSSDIKKTVPKNGKPLNQAAERKPAAQGMERRPNGQPGDRYSSSGQGGERQGQGRPFGEKRPNQNGERRRNENAGGQGAPNRDRQNGQYGDRDRRPGGDRERRSGQAGDRQGNNRAQGQGSQYGDRRQNGQYGDRDRRPGGDRDSRGGQTGDRQGGQYGDRQGGQTGDRRQGGQYGDRRQNGQYGDRDRRPGGDRDSRGGQYGERGERQGGQYGERGDRQGGQYGDRQRGSGSQGGDRQRGSGSGQGRQGSYGDRQQGGSRGGYNKDSVFDKDRDSGHNNRGYAGQRSTGRDGRNSEKSSIKSDLANELTKEQRAAAFNDRNRDKNRERGREHEMDEDGVMKGKKDPNRKGAFIKPKPQPAIQEKEDEIKTIILPEVLTVKELADKMKQTPSAVVKKLFLEGKMVSINQEISYEEAEEIALSFNCIAEKEVKVNVVEELLKEAEEDDSLKEKRPPVVCVMGHVDHGKTSLLDAIRETNVTAKEAGGITQHIGAYVVEKNGEKITFLDTPGHEAFTSMRMRGAQATDIAILVVAADDGVMPQTIEAISHAKAAGVQIIVAVNKIDKPSANVERVKQELTEHELVAEDWGGETIFVPVSAHTKEGIEQLLEMILLTAEMCELKANPNRNARGIVIEAELDKGRGPVATILVQKGTLHVGDCVAIGAAYGKVRAMIDDKGRRVKEALPSTPVEILGLNEVPDAGEIFLTTDSEKEARTISEAFISQGREKLLADTKAKLSLDGLFSQIKAGNIKELNLIIKADVQGSVEAVKQSLQKLSNEEVAVRIIHGGVGAINESDVTLASASNAIIIGFNVRPDNTAKDIADREKVDIRLYRVIYNAIEDVEAAMKGMLDPTYEEKVIGHAEVRQTFKASGLGVIAGSYVLDGKIVRNCQARISREGTQIYEGHLASLKRFKDDVKEVAAGYECGLVFEKFNDLQEFDQVEFYMMVEVPR